jgi:hypothetical protein
MLSEQDYSGDRMMGKSDQRGTGKMAIMRHGCAFILVILAVLAIILPVTAAPAETPMSSSEISIRQTHLGWIALTREAEMNAALTYIYPLYETDTTRLDALVKDFKKQEALIPAVNSREGFDNITRDMRSITAQFQNESEVQMTRGHGNQRDLSQKIGAATTNNPYIGEKKAAYWDTRRTRQIADYDTWVLSSQVSLDLLKKQGFDTAQSQRSLDVIASKRPDLVAALESKDEGRILSFNAVLLPLTQAFGQQVVEAQNQVSDGERTRFFIDQGYRAVSRADAMNADLTVILLDIGPPEPALKKVKTDLTATSRALNTGNLPLAKTPLTLVKKDLKDLSATYRDIANSQDLPVNLTASLRSMVIALDSTADQMEVI